MTREELKKIVFKTHSPLTVEEVMFGIDKYVEQIRKDAIEEAIHKLENSTVNCHEDYVDGIHFAIGVLESIKEQK